MKEDHKKRDIKKSLGTGISGVVGSVVGTGGVNAFTSTSIETENIEEPEILEILSEKISGSEEDSIIPVSVSHPIIDNSGKSNESVSDPVTIPSNVDAVIITDVEEPEVETEEEFEQTYGQEEGIETEVVSSDIVEEEDDIMVVNVIADSESIESTETAAEVAEETYDSTESEEEGIPDYINMEDPAVKDGMDDGIDNGLTSVEMPDYVNNANIDSFTDLN